MRNNKLCEKLTVDIKISSVRQGVSRRINEGYGTPLLNGTIVVNDGKRLAITKCRSINACYAIRNKNVGKSGAAVEGLSADMLYAHRNNNGGKILATVECTVANGLNAHGNLYCSKALAVIESSITDVVNCSRNLDSREFLTTIESSGSDVCKAIRKSNALKCNTITERSVSDRYDRIAEHNLGELEASAEGVSTDILDTIANNYTLKIVTTIESARTNGLNTLTNQNALESVAIVKCILADNISIGYFDLYKCNATCKCKIANLLNARRDVEAYHIGASGESSFADRLNSLGNSNVLNGRILEYAGSNRNHLKVANICGNKYALVGAGSKTRNGVGVIPIQLIFESLRAIRYDTAAGAGIGYSLAVKDSCNNVTKSTNSKCLATKLILTRRAINYAIILAVYNAGRLDAIFFYSGRRGMAKSRNNERLAAKLVVAYRAISHYVVLTVHSTGRLYSILFYSGCRGMTKSRNNERLAAKFSITCRAVGYFIISASLCTGRLYAILFYSRLCLVARLFDLGNINLIAALSVTSTLLRALLCAGRLLCDLKTSVIVSKGIETLALKNLAALTSAYELPLARFRTSSLSNNPLCLFVLAGNAKNARQNDHYYRDNGLNSKDQNFNMFFFHNFTSM